MAQFDVYRNPRRGAYPLLVDLQAEVVARLATRAVAPLISTKRYAARPITRLNPIVSVAGADYVVMVQELAAIPRTALGPLVASLAVRRADLLAALDLLFTGS
jgi:toxin CcdB